MTTPPDPQAVLRSRAYVTLLVLAAVIGVTHLRRGLRLSRPGQQAAGMDLHRLAQRAGLPRGAAVVAGSAPGAGRAPGRAHDPVSARNRRSLACRRVQGRGGALPRRPKLPGIIVAALATLSLGVVLGPEAPLIAIGAGSASALSALLSGMPPARTSAMVAAAGSAAGHQHAARFPSARGLPPDGGLRAGGCHARARADARPGGRRDRFADIHRPGRMDRAWPVPRWRFPTFPPSGSPTSRNSAGRWRSA